MAGSELDEADFTGADLTDANLTGAKLTSTWLFDTSIQGTKFRDTNWDQAYCIRRFTRCSESFLEYRGAILR